VRTFIGRIAAAFLSPWARRLQAWQMVFIRLVLFDNATHAWNAAFYSVPLGQGDRILTGRTGKFRTGRAGQLPQRCLAREDAVDVAVKSQESSGAA
jgi:hypothetical protein